jgi:hypothetical protein
MGNVRYSVTRGNFRFSALALSHLALLTQFDIDHCKNWYMDSCEYYASIPYVK